MARIAVIGAGMGAMAAAARLAVAGNRVTVYERSGTYGGSVGRFEREGFAFDTGPGLLHLPAVYRDLFVKTGKEPLERCVELTQVDPAVRHVFPDGTEVSLPNASRGGVASALDEVLGAGAGERWSAYLGRARTAWDATRRPLLEEPLRADRKALGRDPYPAVRGSGLLRRRPPTLAEVAQRELGDPRLVAVLESGVLAYGLDPRSAPAAAAVLPYMEQTFGSWYVRGGIRALAQALYERCLARGVEFAFGTEVTGVREKDGRAAGVELAGGTDAVAEADFVVSGAPVPGAPVPALYKHHVPAVPATGRFVVCVALSGARPGDAVHRTVVHAADRSAELGAVFDGRLPERPTVTVLRPDDPTLHPEEHESVTLTTVVPAGDLWSADSLWSEPGATERFADRVLAAAAAAVPGLSERLLWREVRTPDDTLRETGLRQVPAPALAGAGGDYLPADNRSPLPGLLFAGGFAHPGGGLAHAGMSGALVAGLIVEGAGFRGSQ
ncbi:NAD(P)/FAD-dependent oxidoreductase [Streptomyces sp. A3M-1-3]|uniref:phytoene desaturase family protein n=1 Tax=Streptomyces sp. A3M-1-3 TaxID=2962044 RepID=UPI0020B75593|nr:NAD(P)/FAD-dependent oxidoreductase [Streptomyces sp. A3M-1-3]MCP3817372.1 NAD(P)/FAD-dependent oxidoreductase [Streptomyces sp. A3M-1-3]